MKLTSIILNKAKKNAEVKARQMVDNYGWTETDQDDIVHSLILEFIQSWPEYNPKRSKPQTFISRIMDNALKDMIKHRQAAVRDYRRVDCSLNDLVPDPEDDKEETSRYKLMSEERSYAHRSGSRLSDLERLQLQMDIEKVYEALTVAQVEICELLKHHLTKTAAARDLCIPLSTLNDKISKIREVFIAYGVVPDGW